MGKKLIKTKIVCTLGPASSSREVLVQMIKAGMDYVRLNFSHGTHEVHRKTFELVRSLSQEFDHQIGIICDIQGPKIRTGLVDPAFNLAVGDEILVTPEKIVGNRQRIQIKYETMLKDLGKGDVIFINDGIVRLVVKEKLEKDLLCVCEAAGNVSDHKGCNIPSGNISLDVLTSKDREDLKLIAELDPEYVALSFIGRAADLHQTRALLAQLGNPRIKLISKVERPVALQYLEEVVAASDAVMVARGDLGVEIPAWEVPAAQKRIVRLCNKESVPVIVATQMLESMVQASRPTRAEASDVFNAVLDGADAVMLSGETSVGAWPVLAVEYMDRIANEAESQMAPRDPNDFDSSKQGIEETIGHAAYSIAGEFRDLKWSGAIVVLADDPALATLISKYRPGLDILAISSNLRTVHELALVWGVRAVHAAPFTGDFEERAAHGVKAVQSLGLLGPSDHVLVIARSRHGVLSGLFPVPRLLL